MKRKSLVILALVLTAAVPAMASQFIELSFDQVARQSMFVVRGTLGPVYSQWDDAHQVIYSYSTIRVTRYFGETTGPDVLSVREVGGTVDGYTQEAIGFPMLREGQNVVLFLSKWDDSDDFRIEAFNQGKFVVRMRGTEEVLTSDPVTQGHARLDSGRGPEMQTEGLGNAMTLDEFEQMVDAARAGARVPNHRD
ncbi:MAG TPA: hypothetical protein VMU84_09720 [Thermoanaerobaculia bacterium]|nr:hypothetical protein [Thermoanaerobaculia bacterium]